MNLFRIVYGLLIHQLFGRSLCLKIDFERTEQLSGFDVYSSTLRVRKYNRTTIVLNGTFTSKIALDNNYKIVTQLFHSPLGNQQFNHYPMKLPDQPVCDFIDMLHDDYGEYLTNVYNMPKRGVCPIKPQSAYTKNKIFPTNAVPPYLPTGLWKIHIYTMLNETEASKYEWIVKIASDLYW
uniref:MD-2-related lipid-recognition domain-containing protein n=1 Tax=Anopheles epiroticus TaxID=199890 RepID=A0A182PLC8_9DIPT